MAHDCTLAGVKVEPAVTPPIYKNLLLQLNTFVQITSTLLSNKIKYYTCTRTFPVSKVLRNVVVQFCGTVCKLQSLLKIY